MFVQLEDSILNISNMLIAPHFHLLMALCLYHKMYCFLIIKQYLFCKVTIFPSFLIIF